MMIPVDDEGGRDKDTGQRDQKMMVAMEMWDNYNDIGYAGK